MFELLSGTVGFWKAFVGRVAEVTIPLNMVSINFKVS